MTRADTLASLADSLRVLAFRGHGLSAADLAKLAAGLADLAQPEPPATVVAAAPVPDRVRPWLMPIEWTGAALPSSAL